MAQSGRGQGEVGEGQGGGGCGGRGPEGEIRRSGAFGSVSPFLARCRRPAPAGSSSTSLSWVFNLSTDADWPRLCAQVVYDPLKGEHYLFGGCPEAPLPTESLDMRLSDFWKLKIVECVPLELSSAWTSGENLTFSSTAPAARRPTRLYAGPSSSSASSGTSSCSLSLSLARVEPALTCNPLDRHPQVRRAVRHLADHPRPPVPPERPLARRRPLVAVRVGRVPRLHGAAPRRAGAHEHRRRRCAPRRGISAGDAV